MIDWLRSGRMPMNTAHRLSSIETKFRMESQRITELARRLGRRRTGDGQGLDDEVATLLIDIARDPSVSVLVKRLLVARWFARHPLSACDADAVSEPTAEERL